MDVIIDWIVWYTKLYIKAVFWVGIALLAYTIITGLL